MNNYIITNRVWSNPRIIINAILLYNINKLTIFIIIQLLIFKKIILTNISQIPIDVITIHKLVNY